MWLEAGEPPPELVRYRLRMMYHCTPSELADQRGSLLWEMYRDLLCATVEAEVERKKHG